MILQREIAAIAEKTGVSKTTIDKDWVLGHFIDAIYSVKELKDILIFKGGTCLKKCYFPDYRFSEDLDFTAIDEKFNLTTELFNKVVALVTKRTGLACQITSFRDLVFKDVKTGYEIIVKYWGSDHQFNSAVPPMERWQTGIKIEIILYELLLLEPAKRTLIHSYSDALSANANEIPCYSLEEVMAEKIRALVQRKYTAPRDYYDIWYLSTNHKDLNHKRIVEAFHKKMKYKNLAFAGIDQLINPKNERLLKRSWQNSLSHQIAKDKLADYATVIADVRGYFERIL